MENTVEYTDLDASITKEMTLAMHELLGSGYVTDYYRQMAGDFINMAQSYVRDAYKAGRDSVNPAEYAVQRANNILASLDSARHLIAKATTPNT